jgi:CBS domain-containing protein
VNVEELMDRQPLTVRPETPVSELARQMYESRRSSVPVVDHEGRVVGIVTMTDLVARNATRSPRFRWSTTPGGWSDC